MRTDGFTYHTPAAFLCLNNDNFPIPEYQRTAVANTYTESAVITLSIVYFRHPQHIEPPLT